MNYCKLSGYILNELQARMMPGAAKTSHLSAPVFSYSDKTEEEARLIDNGCFNTNDIIFGEVMKRTSNYQRFHP